MPCASVSFRCANLTPGNTMRDRSVPVTASSTTRNVGSTATHDRSVGSSPNASAYSTDPSAAGCNPQNVYASGVDAGGVAPVGSSTPSPMTSLWGLDPTGATPPTPTPPAYTFWGVQPAADGSGL